MNILIVLAHPNPASFNFAVLERLTEALQGQGHCVHVRDLYANDFQPVLHGAELASLQQGEVQPEILLEQAEVTRADGLVFLYPLWWSGMPAMLKGWIDRVFTHGFAFRYGANGSEGLLASRRALVLVTAGSGEADFAALGLTPDDMLKPMTQGTLGFCGVTQVVSRMFQKVPGSSQHQRVQMLEEAAALAVELFAD